MDGDVPKATADYDYRVDYVILMVRQKWKKYSFCQIMLHLKMNSNLEPKGTVYKPQVKGEGGCSNVYFT